MVRQTVASTSQDAMPSKASAADVLALFLAVVTHLRRRDAHHATPYRINFGNRPNSGNHLATSLKP
jgi:hypothetical protein